MGLVARNPAAVRLLEILLGVRMQNTLDVVKVVRVEEPPRLVAANGVQGTGRP